MICPCGLSATVATPGVRKDSALRVPEFLGEAFQTITSSNSPTHLDAELTALQQAEGASKLWLAVPSHSHAGQVRQGGQELDENAWSAGYRIAVGGQSRDTGRMLGKGIEGARAALRAGRPADLLGLAECGWLDVKAGVYQLDDPAKALELAKDVAAFANTGTGGMILVGYSTRKEHDREILEEIRPVIRALVDLDRYRKLIRERVIPRPRGFSVDFIHTDADSGILVIDVPVQPVALLPYVVPGPAMAAGPSRLSVAVPVREADATAWLPQTEIQRLLAAGWTATGGPSEGYVSDLIQQAVTATRRDAPPPKPAFQVGDGAEPGWKGPFRQAWEDLIKANIPVGEPVSGVYAEGPGVAQHFDPGQSPFGWVICALPRKRPVAVAGEVWHALQAAGAGFPGGEPFSAVGFPVPYPQATRRIDAHDASVDLNGGRWGKGMLLRDSETAEWRWAPTMRFSMDMTRSAGYWTSDRTVHQLRLRAIATFPWADAGELAIASQRRLDFEQDLPLSRLAGVVTTLSLRRGADLRAAIWHRGPNRNALDALGYSSAIAAPDGTTALSAQVMAALPGAMDSSVVTCADVRVEDLNAWAEALAASGDPPRQDIRLSMEEVAEVLTVAWQTATERLTAVVADDPAGLRWEYPPTVELRLTAEARYDGTPGRQPELSDYIDMSALGQTDRGQIRGMAVTITAPPQLDQGERKIQARKALVYMARQFGFLEATEDRL